MFREYACPCTCAFLLRYKYLLKCTASATAKSLQLCLTLCNPIDGSPPGSPVPGILQARTLEWVAISFSKAWKWKVKVKSLSRVLLLATPWTAAYQAPLSMGFSRQEYWSGLPLPCTAVFITRLPILKIIKINPISIFWGHHSQRKTSISTVNSYIVKGHQGGSFRKF